MPSKWRKRYDSSPERVRRILSENRPSSIDLTGVPQLPTDVDRLLREGKRLTTEQQAQADAAIAAGTEEIQRRLLAKKLRQPAPPGGKGFAERPRGPAARRSKPASQRSRGFGEYADLAEEA